MWYKLQILLSTYRTHLTLKASALSLARVHRINLNKLLLLEELEKDWVEPGYDLTTWLSQPDPRLKSTQTRADYLSQRNTPLPLLFLQIVLVILTFPLALPVLFLWSFLERDHGCFWKTDGQLFVESLKAMPKEAFLPTPTSSLDGFAAARLGMTARKGRDSTTDHSSRKNPMFNPTATQTPATTHRATADSAASSLARGLASFIAPEGDVIQATLTGLPELRGGQLCFRPSRQAGLPDEFEVKIHYQLKFSAPKSRLGLDITPAEYQAMQETNTDAQLSEDFHRHLTIRLFADIPPVRPIFQEVPFAPRQITTPLAITAPAAATSAIPPERASLHARFKSACARAGERLVCFFTPKTPPKPSREPTFSELMEKGDLNFYSAGIAKPAFQQALEKATTTSEIVLALEGLIALMARGYDYIQRFEINEARKKARLAEYETSIHTYVNQLPDHYWLYSEPIQNLTARLIQIRDHLKAGDISAAYESYTPIDFPRLLIFQYIAPHLLVWVRQFAIIFNALGKEERLQDLTYAGPIGATIAYTQKILIEHYPQLAVYFNEHTVQPFKALTDECYEIGERVREKSYETGERIRRTSSKPWIQYPKLPTQPPAACSSAPLLHPEGLSGSRLRSSFFTAK